MGGRRTFRVDLHVHSQDSYDGHEPVELILEHASEIGLDGVVITDHDTMEASRRAAELAPEYGLVGIPGVEVSTAHGHLLAIGVDERPAKGRPLAETVATVRALGGAAVVPHPFQRSRHGVRKRNLVDCDALEVYNSMLFTGYRNRRANRFAERHGYVKVGGSDAHYLPNVGRAYTEIRLARGRDVPASGRVAGATLVRALGDGATAISGERTPIRRSARHYAAGAARKGAFALTSRAPYVPPWPASLSDS